MDFASAKVTGSGNNLHVSHGDDSGLFVEFEMRPIKQEFESEQKGRPIFKDVPYINIMFPGDRTKQIVRPVKMDEDGSGPSDLQRFPRQWAAFESKKEQVQDGTPLEQWAPLTRSQVMELKGIRIHTVEQLASLPDSTLNWMGARDLREKAKVWLANAGGSNAEVLKLQHENQTLAEDIAMLKDQIRELAAMKSASAPADAPADAPAEKPSRRAAAA